MTLLNHYINEYRKQVEKGEIKIAYQAIMEFMSGLKIYLRKKHPGHFVSGSLYYGLMDMTYFSFTSPVLKKMQLKTAVVFVHEKTGIEIWLAGVNKEVQKRYWEILRNNAPEAYNVPSSIKGVDFIIEYDVANSPDFDNQAELMVRIEKGLITFERDMEKILAGK